MAPPTAGEHRRSVTRSESFGAQSPAKLRIYESGVRTVKASLLFVVLGLGLVAVASGGEVVGGGSWFDRACGASSLESSFLGGSSRSCAGGRGGAGGTANIGSLSDWSTIGDGGGGLGGGGGSGGGRGMVTSTTSEVREVDPSLWLTW